MGSQTSAGTDFTRFWSTRERSPRNHARATGLILIFLMMMTVVRPAGAGANIGSSAQRVDISAAQINESLVLKMLIQSMMDLIDTGQSRAFELSQTLDGDATVLKTSFAINGLRTTLSSQEVLDGLEATEDALNLLNDPGIELDITPSMIPELIQTISAIHQELSNVI